MNYYENPDLEWYKKISAKNKVPPRCPYTMLYTCPIYFESIALLRNTGATELDKNDEEKLIKYWKDRELNPSLLEETPGVLHHKTKGFSSLHNFCPEAIYLRFGYFASFISNFEDETDQAMRHFDLKKRDISLHSWAWNWSNLKAKHYTDCRLYSILSNPKKNKVVDNIINNNQERNKIEENNKEPKIFLSYSHRNKEIADRVDKFFISKKLPLTKDERDASPYSDLKKFMDTIRDHDYVIMLISDAYLKSTNCMYEVVQFIQEKNYSDRIFPIVIDNEVNIFDQSEHSKYINYWQAKHKELGDKIKTLKNNGIISLHEELDKINIIQSNIGKFLKKIVELKCIPLDELESTNYKAILDKISKTFDVPQKKEVEIKSDKLKLRTDDKRATNSATKTITLTESVPLGTPLTKDGITVTVQRIERVEQPLWGQPFEVNIYFGVINNSEQVLLATGSLFYVLDEKIYEDEFNAGGYGHIGDAISWIYPGQSRSVGYTKFFHSSVTIKQITWTGTFVDDQTEIKLGQWKN